MNKDRKRSNRYRRKRLAEMHSNKYAKLRKYIFARDNYTCALTGVRGGQLEMHHILPYSQYPKLRFEPCNLITLSQRAHEAICGEEAKYAERLLKIAFEREGLDGKLRDQKPNK